MDRDRELCTKAGCRPVDAVDERLHFIIARERQAWTHNGQADHPGAQFFALHHFQLGIGRKLSQAAPAPYELR